MDRETYESILDNRYHEAEAIAMLDAYGDEIAKRQGYRVLRGFAAVEYFLTVKYG